MNRRVSILMALLGASACVAALVPATHAQASAPPSVQIANGAVTATVYLPVATVGYYRGTRFEWAGVIGRLEYRGQTFYAPWFTKTDAAVRDFVNDGVDVTAGPHTAVTGPAEEFSVLGFAQAAPGGPFVKIGVGALRRPDDGSRFTIENRKAGAGVEMTGDRPLDRLALWSIRTVLALEPFLAIDIAPGAEDTWEYTYRYYTIP